METFDVGIIGAGVAGAFASVKLATEHKDVKTIVFELGSKWAKRRRQLEAWLGCLPSSDGKFYLQDINKVQAITTEKRSDDAFIWIKNYLYNINDLKTIKDKEVSVNLSKKIKKNEYDISYNDYIQFYPKDIHSLSKYMATSFDKKSNITFSFNNEVYKIIKYKDYFYVLTCDGEFACKKLIFCVGRSGWRWAKEIYNDFNIISDNNIAKFGIRAEMPISYMKDFNKSNCTIYNDNIEIGPFSWNGTVIPEDHVDMAISAFRGNEGRWETDKVSFNIIGNRYFKDNGFEQIDRLSKLTFILTNERISKEKISLIMNKKSKISVMSEYDWLIDEISKLTDIIPELQTRGYFHVPTIIPSAPKININKDLSTDVDGLYIAGESSGVSGILSAAMTGIICANSVSK